MKLKVLERSLATVLAAAATLALAASVTAATNTVSATATNAIAAGKFIDTPEVAEMLRKADAYANGDGGKKDPKKAYKLHLKAAQLGSARAQCLVGLDCADGMGTKKDSAQAVKWLQKSAEQGWPSAQFDLGLCYAMGNVAGKTTADAATWYRKAAEQGLPDAEWALGNAYLEGAGLPKDIPEGIYWIRRSAEKGYPAGQRSLGICYTHGTGVPKDLVQAYKWLDLAAAKDDLNSDDIRVNLSMAERFMTPAQIAEGQRLAHEFKPTRIPLPGEPPPKDNAADHHPITSTPGMPAAATSAATAPAHATTSTATSAASTTPTAVTTPAATAPPPASATPAAAPATAAIGIVHVNCDDPTSEVYVNSAFVGNAPAKLKLVVGPQVIEVKRSGFKGYKREINISDGDELTLNVVLEKQ